MTEKYYDIIEFYKTVLELFKIKNRFFFVVKIGFEPN